jgi:phosphoserine aminotransferase
MLVSEWVKNKGGIDVIEKESRERAETIYSIIDSSDFFVPAVSSDSRSYTNITFRLKDESLEKTFISEAANAGLVGLKGHRSVGGIRVSNYNAMTLDGIKKLGDFMKAFEQKA